MNFKHGMCDTPTWRSWMMMRRRCAGKVTNSKWYEGIDLCPEWNEFNAFLRDMGIRPPGTSIDRIDGSKGYSKDNCRWADRLVQGRNRRGVVNLTKDGETMCVSQWAKRLGLTRSAIERRIAKGWPLHQVLSPERYIHVKREPA